MLLLHHHLLVTFHHLLLPLWVEPIACHHHLLISNLLEAYLLHHLEQRLSHLHLHLGIFLRHLIQGCPLLLQWINHHRLPIWGCLLHLLLQYPLLKSQIKIESLICQTIKIISQVLLLWWTNNNNLNLLQLNSNTRAHISKRLHKMMMFMAMQVYSKQEMIGDLSKERIWIVCLEEMKMNNQLFQLIHLEINKWKSQ